MARKVVGLDGVVSAWVRGVEARTPRGSLRTDGKTIWSYGDHFPIAVKPSAGSGVRRVWWNKDRYSNTTSKHQSRVLRVLQGCLLVPVSTELLKCVARMPDESAALDSVEERARRLREPCHEQTVFEACDRIREALKQARMLKAGSEFEKIASELQLKRALMKLAE